MVRMLEEGADKRKMIESIFCRKATQKWNRSRKTIGQHVVRSWGGVKNKWK